MSLICGSNPSNLNVRSDPMHVWLQEAVNIRGGRVCWAISARNYWSKFDRVLTYLGRKYVVCVSISGGSLSLLHWFTVDIFFSRHSSK